MMFRSRAVFCAFLGALCLFASGFAFAQQVLTPARLPGTVAISNPLSGLYEGYFQNPKTLAGEPSGNEFVVIVRDRGAISIPCSWRSRARAPTAAMILVR